jgi:hypothetical protein
LILVILKPVLGETALMLTPFLDEIVFIGGVTLGLLITDRAQLLFAARAMSMPTANSAADAS